jgi:putative hydrolase of the HAD superfamily
MQKSVITKESLSKSWLVLDVDGVLLDPALAGRGSWSQEFSKTFRVDASGLREQFFKPFWNDVVTGRRDIVPALEEALVKLRWNVEVDEVLRFWFETDFSPNERVLSDVRDIARAGASIALATNQEHQRARFLKERLAQLVPIDGFVYSADVGLRKAIHGSSRLPSVCSHFPTTSVEWSLLTMHRRMSEAHGWRVGKHSTSSRLMSGARALKRCSTPRPTTIELADRSRVRTLRTQVR